jgi:dTMP kinase
MPKALYLTLDGVDGCGKSTQARRIAHRLDAIHTKEPGGTELGSRLRETLLDPGLIGKIIPMAELLLMNADRVQHFHDVVLPALQAGRHVVSDRSFLSSLAYQGYGRGIPTELIHSLTGLVLGELLPHRMFVLDIDFEQMAERRGKADHDDTDRFELEQDSFRQRVMEGFRTEAARAAGFNAVLIDARADEQTVEDRIWAHIEPLLPKEAM